MPRIMCHHYKLSDTDKEFIQGKIDRLRKFFDRITEVSVILDSAKRTSQAEILISAPQLNLHCRDQAEDMRTAFENALNKAERLLRKSKDKLYGNKKHGRNSVTIRRFPPASLPDVGTLFQSGLQLPEGVSLEEVEPRPMNLEEAHNLMLGSERSLMVFFNAETLRMNVLHRHDEQIELVEFDGQGNSHALGELEPVVAEES